MPETGVAGAADQVVERQLTDHAIALLGPYLALIAGAVAAWLGKNFPGLDIDGNETAQYVAQAAHFAVGALVAWGLQHRYLGHVHAKRQAVHHARRAAAHGDASAQHAAVPPVHHHEHHVPPVHHEHHVPPVQHEHPNGHHQHEHHEPEHHEPAHHNGGAHGSGYPGSPLHIGARGDHVRAWQEHMRHRGFLLLEADGIYGHGSAEACRWLQDFLGVPITGKVDHVTWEKTFS